MAYLALLWKGRTIEKYRINYEKEKLESLLNNDADLPKNYFTEKHKHFQRDTRKKMEQTFKQWCPNIVANVLFYLTTDQTFPNFLLKSALGFGGGIILTYLCFMFFVFQLSISLMHATIMSCVIGVLLTLGLAFSYRVRCLVFLLIPQFFSRVGRYTLTCYALILILTGPATNTLKNSEVLSESMACGQEQIKLHVHQLNDFLKNPLNLVRDSIKNIVERMKYTSSVFREMLHRTNRLALSIVRIFQSSFLWLHSTAPLCNEEFGTPYERCVYLLDRQISRQNVTYYNNLDSYNEYRRIVEAICSNVKNRELICAAHEYAGENIGALIKRRLKNFSEHIKAMLYLDIKIHHTYSYCGNVNKTASQTAAGIVTEIRNRADPLITWLSWSSCGTSLFLFLIIFRAKYYQHMFETRSRFDNQYVTKELRDLDLKRQKQGRETILPLNRREQMKYISATSFKLVPSERVYLSRSAVFMTITTFKLLIHIVADYSLFWILTIIRQHGRFQTTLPPGYTNAGIKASGTGPVARFLQSIIDSLNIPLATPSPSPITCLPDPLPPDLRRYTQIGVLIVLLWFFALFEPYGLRLRHVIMGMYRPERAKARAAWLYNHILTTRGSFMKYARRKLHRQFKYSTESKYTFRYWLNSYIPCWWLQTLLGTAPDEPHCLLCSTKEYIKDSDTKLVRCETPDCPGIFCVSCFSDIGELCTICLPPADYGDLSDVSLEKGSSDDDTDDGHNDAAGKPSTSAQLGKNYESLGMFKQYKRRNQDKYSKTSEKGQENIPLLKRLISYDMVTETQVNLINVEVTGESKLKTKVYVDFNNNTIESALRLTQLKLNIQVSQTLCLKKYYKKEDNFDIKTYVDIKQFIRIKPNSHLIFVSDQFTPFMFDESISGKFSASKEEIANNRRHGINYERSRKSRKRRTRKISCNKCCCLKKLCCLFSCAKNSVKSHHSGIIKSPSALSLSKVVATKQVSHIKRSDSKKRTKKKSDTAINIYFQNVHCLNFQSSSGVGVYDLKELANKDIAIKKSIDTNKPISCACINDSRKTSKEFVDNNLRKDKDPVHSITNKKSCINLKNNAELNIMRAEKSIRKKLDSKGASKKESLKIKSDSIIRKKEVVDKYKNLSESKVNTTSKSPKRTAKQYEEKTSQKSNVALSPRKSKTVDKFALAVPKVKSSACQCYASDSVRTNKHTTRNDKRMKHVTSQCTCATQYYTETRDVGILAHVKSPKCTKEKTMKHIEKAAKKMFQQEETGSEMSSISSSAYSRVIQFVQVFKENRTKKHGTNTIKKNKEHPTNDNDWWSPMMKKKEIITSSDSDKCNDKKTLCLQRKNVKPNNDTDVRIEINTRHHKKKIQEIPTWKKL